MKGNNPQQDEAIILSDFAENFSFVILNAIPGFHWENSQARLQLLVVYDASSHNNLESLSICVVFDQLLNNQSAVHAFLVRALSLIKTKLPSVKKVIYFGDGAASQYKNCKEFINLCFHQ